jgi:hypothetical protein
MALPGYTFFRSVAFLCSKVLPHWFNINSSWWLCFHDFDKFFCLEFCLWKYSCRMSVFTVTTTYNFIAGWRKMFQAGCACWIPTGAFCVAVSWLVAKTGPVKGRLVSSFWWKLWPRERPFCFYFFQPSSGLAMLTSLAEPVAVWLVRQHNRESC